MMPEPIELSTHWRVAPVQRSAEYPDDYRWELHFRHGRRHPWKPRPRPWPSHDFLAPESWDFSWADPLQAMMAVAAHYRANGLTFFRTGGGS